MRTIVVLLLHKHEESRTTIVKENCITTVHNSH